MLCVSVGALAVYAKKAENRGTRITVSPWGGGRLIDTPGLLRDWNARDLYHESSARFGGVALSIV